MVRTERDCGGGREHPGRLADERDVDASCSIVPQVGTASGKPRPTYDSVARRSAEELGLKKSDSVTAVVKATEVMLSKP
jgi:hypothetical protein